MTKENNIEKKILESAKQIFHIKGYDGARMQEIADLAGINKALLHYYFRSKEKLFDAILFEAVNHIIPKVATTLIANISFEKKIEIIVSDYIDLLTQNPFLPVFILHEVTKDPTKIKELIEKAGIKPHLIVNGIQMELDQRKIKHIEAFHLIVNLISLCVFPFAGKPILMEMFFNGNTANFNQFIKERKTQITNFVLSSLKNE